jgi:NADH-quinone oxidoreductase subunit L
MVAAGVYLVARLFPIYSVSDEAMAVVATIGAITAVVAATMGLVMHDLKRVLAYSTISQLGYMMLALGSGGLVAGIFHLFNHAFFKALLFLGSGSVNHGTGTFDMRKMGGLARPMPLTFLTFAIGSLSLAGIWPLSGFWSKDEVLLDAWHYNKVIFAAALGVAFMTAFYMTRAVCLTFFGEYRGGDPSGVHHAAHGDANGHGVAPHHSGGDEAHEIQGTGTVAHAGHDTHKAADEVTPHESPPSMVLPLLILAIPSIASGFLNAGGFFGKNFGHFDEASLPDTMHLEHHAFSWGIALTSSALAVFGIVLAAALYGGGARVRVGVPAGFRWLYTLFYRKYFMDDIYEDGVVRGLLQRGICALSAWFDAKVVDGAVNGVARLASWLSGLLRRVQTGSEQSYGLVLTGGAAIVALVVFVSALR